MSKIKSGILGGFSGKIANVIGSRSKGKNIIRSKQYKSSNLTNKSRSLNSIRLAEINLLWSVSKVHIEYFMSLFNFDFKLTKNEFVKSAYANSLFVSPYYANNIELGYSSFVTSLRSSDFVIYNPNLIQISLTNVVSFLVKSPNARIRFGSFTSSTGVYAHFAQYFLNNTEQQSLPFYAPDKGDFVVFYSFVQSTLDLSKSQLFISVRMNL